MEEASQTWLQSFKEFFSGCTAGVCQVYIGQPFDIIKVRLQNQPAGKQKYKNAFDCL